MIGQNLRGLGFLILLFLPMVGMADVCEYPEKGTNWVSNDSRDKCVQRAHLLLKDTPEINLQTILEGPSIDNMRDNQWGGFDLIDPVRCQYKQEDWGGYSPKFWCYRTDETGNLYPEDADDVGDSLEADEMGDEIKVKYIQFNSVEIDETGFFEYDVPSRQREPFTEVAATRYFWSLGIPADRVYPVESVVCDGCTSDPYKSQEGVADDQSNLFSFAAIERKYDAKRLEPFWVRQKGEKIGVHFEDEIAVPGNPLYQRIELEVLMLASGTIGFYNPKSQQNRLACPRRVPDGLSGFFDARNKETGTCDFPIAMVHDLGGSFGGRRKVILGFNPRGDFDAFEDYEVFVDSKKCKVERSDFTDDRYISEEARQEFLRRVAPVEPYLRNILEYARFQHIDTDFRKDVREETGLKREALDNEVLNRWAAVWQSKINDVKNAGPCR